MIPATWVLPALFILGWWLGFVFGVQADRLRRRRAAG